jgi:hypothetical protein
MGVIQGVAHSDMLPCILPSDFKIGDVLNGTTVAGEQKGEVTFEGSPKCAIAFRGRGGIRFDSGSSVQFYNVPLLSQISPFLDDTGRGYCLTYANFKRDIPFTEIRGILSIFYMEYFAIIRQGIRIELTAKTYLTDVISEDFRAMKTFEINNTPVKAVLLELDDFKVTTAETATAMLYQNTEVNENDKSKTAATPAIYNPVLIDTLPL